MTRQCAICSKPFTSTAPNKLYCSHECAKVGKRLRAYKPTIVNCLSCGKPIECNKTKPRKFCSMRCANKYNYEVHKASIKADRFLYRKPNSSGRKSQCFYCPFKGWKCRNEAMWPCSGFSPIHDEYKQAIANVRDEAYIT